MEDNILSEKLIQELLKDPVKFNKQGKAYALLQKYFDGLSFETLRSLLKSKDQHVLHAAVWIASELGKQAACLIEEVVPLIDSGDRYIIYHALEIIMVCSFSGNVDEFIHVIYGLESNDEVIRKLSMRLISNASNAQLKAVFSIFESNCEKKAFDKLHYLGVKFLLDFDNVSSENIVNMLSSNEFLYKIYGAILAKKNHKKFPELLNDGSLSKDADVRKFCAEMIVELPGD